MFKTAYGLWFVKWCARGLIACVVLCFIWFMLLFLYACIVLDSLLKECLDGVPV